LSWRAPGAAAKNPPRGEKMRRVGWGGPGRPDVFDRPGGSPFGRPPCRLPPRRPPGPLAISAKLRGAPPLVCMSICMQNAKSPPHGALAEERTRTCPWCRRRRRYRRSRPWGDATYRGSTAYKYRWPNRYSCYIYRGAGRYIIGAYALGESILQAVDPLYL